MPGPDRQGFVSSLYPIARAYAAQTGLPAEVFLAIAAHESNFGAAGSNMLFGIKGPGRSMQTYEVEGGRDVPQAASFRTYASPADAFRGFVDLVSSGRYAGAWNHLQQTGDWHGFLQGINRAGYATDPTWADKIARFTTGTIAPLVRTLGPRTAEAAELGGEGVDDDRPPSTYDAPSRFGGNPPAALSPGRRRIAKQLQQAQSDLEQAQTRYDNAVKARNEPIRLATSEEEQSDSVRRRAEELNDAERAVDDARKRVLTLEKEDADAEEQEAADAAKAEAARQKALDKQLADATTAARKPPPTRTSPAGVTQLYENGDWVDHPELGVRTPASATPRATRSYRQGGVSYAETAPDAGGFQPIAGPVDNPDAMTPYQAAQLPISQQNADTSRISAAASMLHAQVAQGTLDFNQAKQIFDYVRAQSAPVEEGGKLYQSGFSPSNKVRQFYNLDPEPYAVMDAPGFFGREDLRQHIRGPYPFGGGPMSPQEYQARQAGAFQAPPPQALPARAGPPQPTDQGFQPLPAPAPPPQQPSAPQFGAPPQQDEQRLMANLARIRASLVQQGVDPTVAEQAARDFLRIPEPAGLGGAY